MISKEDAFAKNPELVQRIADKKLALDARRDRPKLTREEHLIEPSKRHPLFDRLGSLPVREAPVTEHELETMREVMADPDWQDQCSGTEVEPAKVESLTAIADAIETHGFDPRCPHGWSIGGTHYFIEVDPPGIWFHIVESDKSGTLDFRDVAALAAWLREAERAVTGST